MAAVKVVAPLVLAKDQEGHLVYSYRGQVIPWLSNDDRARLVADGLVEQAGDEPEPAAPVAAPEVPEAVVLARPSQTAPKAAWVEYAVSKGVATKSEAEDLTKPELIALLSD